MKSRGVDLETGSNNMSLVSVIIINWNQAMMTKDCILSLQESDYEKIKVIIVDSGSTDNSVEEIRNTFNGIEVIELGENLGYSDGNNVGIRSAIRNGTDYVLLLNNDTTVDSKMISNLVQVADSDPRIGIVGPTQFYFDRPDIIWGAANYVNWSRGSTIRSFMDEAFDKNGSQENSSDIIDADYIDTCAALVRREVFEEAGLLDTKYFINFDDADLGLRTNKAGYRVVYSPNGKMWHKVSAAMGQASPATTYYMTRNQLLFFSQHAKGWNRISAFLSIVFRTVRTIIAWSIKPRYSQDDLYRRRRDANFFALRDFMFGRFGKMGADVAKVCCQK